MTKQNTQVRLLMSKGRIEKFLDITSRNPNALMEKGLAQPIEHSSSQRRYFLSDTPIEAKYFPEICPHSLMVEIYAPAGVSWGERLGQFTGIIEGVAA